MNTDRRLRGSTCRVPVALSRDVLHQKNLAAAKRAAGAIGYFQLNRFIQQHNELSLRRIVPVVVVPRLVLAEV